MSEPKCEQCADIGWRLRAQLGRLRAFICPFCESFKDDEFINRVNDARLPGNSLFARFDNFRLQTPSDKGTITELVKLAKNPDQGFVLAGSHGTGKTHLLTAFSKSVLYSHKKKVLYTSLFDLIAEMRAIYTNGEMGEEHRYLTVDILIIDDFWGINDPSGWNVKLLEKVINERSMRSLPIVIGTSHFAFVPFTFRSLERDVDDKSTVLSLTQAFPERLIHMLLENGQYFELRGEDTRKQRLPESFLRSTESSGEYKRRGPSLS